MNYSEALDLSRQLASKRSVASKLLDAMCAKTGRLPTFILMRYGDPRQWAKTPKKCDGRKTRTKHTVRHRVRATSQIKGKRTITRLGKEQTWTRKTKDWRVIVNTRACTLEHIDGGVIRAKSITAFCKAARLTERGDRYHVTPVLDGNRPSFKGWYLPDFLRRTVKIRDIYDNVLKVTVRELITRYGVNSSTLNRLLDGRAKSILGNRIMLAETPVDSILKPRDTETVEVKLTDGRKVFTGRTVSEAARQAGIRARKGLYATAYGFRNQWAGLRVKSIKIAKKQVLV